MKICGETHGESAIPTDRKQKLGDIPQLQAGGLLEGRRAHQQLIHEFTNTITAVNGYSELAFRAVEECHQTRAWLEKVDAHTRQRGSLLNKLIDLERLLYGGP